MPSTTNEQMSESGRRESEDHSNTSENMPRLARRPRVALACQRCKKRKQKCDGGTPACANCKSFNAECRYIRPLVPRTRDPYLRAAEDRVAQLEATLATHGIEDGGQGEWRQLQSAQVVVETPDTNEATAPETIQRPPKRPHVESTPPAHSDAEVEWEGQAREKDTNTVVDILRDLSLEASGGYIGASSSISMSRMVRSLVRTPIEPGLANCGLRVEEHLSPKSSSDGAFADDVILELGSLPENTADKLLKGYLKHISTRWPILHSNYIRTLHHNRHALVDSYEKSVLHLVYASGARFLETTGETGAFFPDRHHSAGMQYLDEMLQYHDMRSVQILILLAIYSLRAPKGPGAWTFIGLAMRTCIDLGLHRKTPVNKYSLLDVEMRKRIFWTCYCLDRQISIILGRPFAISDRDIDAELPLDVDESVQDISGFETALRNLQSTPVDEPPSASTSLSCFIHICRLRRMESQIQQSIYRVDDSTNATELEVDSFIRQLEQWKEKIPADARQHNADKPSTRTDTFVIDGYGYYMVYYYKCMRFLLHPLLPAKNTNLRYLKLCAEACGDVCQTYKKLHQSIPIGFSLMALHSVFLAGLTLAYCTWISPQEVFSIKTSNDMNACSIVLYIITERWPGAKKYRDTYEAIKQSLLESVEENKYEPRRAIKRLYPDLLPSMARNEEGSSEVSQIVADMAGEQMLIDDLFPTPSQTASANTVSNMISNVPTTAAEPSISMDFQQQSGSGFEDTLFTFDNLDIINGFDIGDFDMSRTPF